MASYGMIPDVRDDRDHKFMLGAPGTRIQLPPSIDLEPWCPPVLDQSIFSTCTAHGVVGAMRYDLINTNLQDVELSVAQNYWDAGMLEGTPMVDCGRQIRDAVKAAANTGVAPAALWPYDMAHILQPPQPETYEAAAQHMVSEYQSVKTDKQSVRTALYVGRPVIIGVELYAQFESAEAQATGRIAMPRAGQTPVGAHCMLLIGYRDGHDKVRNSWGAGWGDHGNAWFPEGYLEGYGRDFWVIYRSSQGDHIMYRRQFTFGGALAVAGCATFDAEIARAADDVALIASGFASAFANLGSLGVVSPEIAAKVAEYIGQLQRLASALKIAATTTSAQTLIGQVLNYVTAIVGVLAGLPLPPPLPAILQAAVVLLPVIEALVGIVTAAPRTISASAAAQARLVLASAAKS